MSKAQQLDETMRAFSPAYLLDTNRDPYILLQVDGVQRAIHIASPGFRDFVQHAYFKAHKAFLDKRTIAEYAAICRYNALEADQTVGLPIRVAQDGDDILYDLSRSDGKQVRISAGSWEIQSQQQTFLNCVAEAPMPEQSGSIQELAELLNVADPDQLLLVLVCMISWLIPDISRPILVLTGEQGSGKSSIARILKRTIDPSTSDILAKTSSMRDLELAIGNGIVTALDNMSYMTDEFSDFLCGVVTGQSVIRRKLFTDDSCHRVSYHGALILNGINSVVRKPDLNDRCIAVELSRIPDRERKSDNEIFSRFDAARPRILGAIFTILSKALQAMKTQTVDFELKRLADFTRVGYFIAEGIEVGGGQRFLRAYDENVGIVASEIIGTYPVIMPLVEYTRTLAPSCNMLFTDFYNGFREYANKNCAAYVLRNFPKAPNALSRILRTCIGSIEQQGVRISVSHRRNGQYIQIEVLSGFEATRGSSQPETSTETEPSAQPCVDCAIPSAQEPEPTANPEPKAIPIQPANTDKSAA